ncbi:hypothetical protein [Euzebya tangerina]|uniref:hypothetical protein n=1 Tax=Euzebya tangerina TaxID=591198 RepID=UPI000E32038C|nr:hypothetical protein [Euzebya tangerina]
MKPVVLANVASSVFMAGMIWTIQVVHYPLFEQVGEGTFVAYMAEHQRRISLVILLPWAVEGLSSLALVADPPDGVGRVLPLAGLAAAGVAVLATVGLAVPEHGRLSDGIDLEAIRRLVSTNWVRTAAWSAHAGIALWIAARAARRG